MHPEQKRIYQAMTPEQKLMIAAKRGRPVARIVKENKGDKSIRAALGPLIQKGLVVLPSRSILKDRHAPLKVSGKPISEMVVEDRR